MQKVRREDLKKALAAAGVDKFFKGKSLLNSYIHNNSEKQGWTMHDVVSRICQMKYLSEYCHLESFLDAVIQNRRAHPNLVNNKPMYEEAELDALATHECIKGQVGYPDVFPWTQSISL